MLLSILICTDTSIPHLRGAIRPRVFGVLLMEENMKVIEKTLAVAEARGHWTRSRPSLSEEPPMYGHNCTLSSAFISSEIRSGRRVTPFLVRHLVGIARDLGVDRMSR